MFQLLSQLLGFPTDQLKYLLCMLMSFPLALILREVLSYKTTSVKVRDTYSALFGLLFCLICFDWSTIYLIVFTIICYGMLYLIRRDVVHWYTLSICLLSVCSCHIYRMIVSYGGNSKLDIVTPLMVMTQRLTYVAFSYHDGGRKEEELNKDQKENRITTIPSLIEYFSYVFSFYSVLTGPTTAYKQHKDMITGDSIEKHLSDGKVPSYLLAVLEKTVTGFMFLLAVIMLGSLNLDKRILNDQELPLYMRLTLISIYCCIQRFSLIFAWKTVEGVSNITGLGFNGFDDRGKPKWNLVTNVYIFDAEFGSLPVKVKSINRLTVKWLRRIIYERLTWHPYEITYGISLIWHGFYPGQFIFYFCVLVGIEASRRINYNIFPYFKSSRSLLLVYNVVTIIGIYIFANFSQLAFVFLKFDVIYTLWKYYYFTPLIITLATVILLPTSNPTAAAKKND